MRSGIGFLDLPLIGQRQIVPIVCLNLPRTPPCVYSSWTSSISGFNSIVAINGSISTSLLRKRQYVHIKLSQCFISYDSTNHTALWVTGYLEDLSAVLVVDELQRQAAIDVAVRASRWKNWSVWTPPTFTRRTASELITVHRPKPLLPSSGLFQESSILHIFDTQRVCSVSLTTDSANLCGLLQEYHRILLTQRNQMSRQQSFHVDDNCNCGGEGIVMDCLA